MDPYGNWNPSTHPYPGGPHYGEIAAMMQQEEAEQQATQGTEQAAQAEREHLLLLNE